VPRRGVSEVGVFGGWGGRGVVGEVRYRSRRRRRGSCACACCRFETWLFCGKMVGSDMRYLKRIEKE
jgi:hypothetical protein